MTTALPPASDFTGTARTQGQCQDYITAERAYLAGLLGTDGTAATALNTLGIPLAVAQVVSTVTGAVASGATVIPFDDTIPQNTEGVQFMTLAITPTNASSKLVITVVIVLASSVANANLIAALFQDSTAGALAAAMQYAGGASANTPMTITFDYSMTAGTTSATTFKVRGGSSSAGTTTFNGSAAARIFGGVMTSSITIYEVLP